jgi:hypothetical protein
MAWTGEEVLVVSARTSADGREVLDETLLSSWDPATGSWQQMPSVGLQISPFVTWSGSELVIVDFAHHAAAFDPAAETWRSLPDVPTTADFEGCGGSLTTEDGTPVVEVCGDAYELSPDDEWVPLDEEPSPAAAEGRTATADDGTTYVTDGEQIWAHRPPD